jgi:hypothetical protein
MSRFELYRYGRSGAALLATATLTASVAAVADGCSSTGFAYGAPVFEDAGTTDAGVVVLENTEAGDTGQPDAPSHASDGG